MGDRQTDIQMVRQADRYTEREGGGREVKYMDKSSSIDLNNKWQTFEVVLYS